MAATQGPARSQQDPEQLTEQELDSMIASALECPCVKDLREGPCGDAFKAAFTCFHKSMAAPKGYECLGANNAFTECLKQHPKALDSLQSAGEEGGLMIPPGPPDNHYNHVPSLQT